MLAGLPLLKELDCTNGLSLTGNIRSLRVLKDTLEQVTIDRCRNVEGNFMDLADFPHLKKLNLGGTALTGDIRDIGDNDFSSLEQLILPKSVYGGRDSKFQRISDGPDLIRVVYLFNKKQHHPLLKLNWFLELSEHSPDWYEMRNEYVAPPFYIVFVQAGSRVGYRWETANQFPYDFPCEVNWLDPEPDPDRESDDYEKYIEELKVINSQVKFYKGLHQPPTEAEYQILLEEYDEENEEDEEELANEELREEWPHSYDPFFGLG
jgi:hypothetical protein